MTGPQNHRRARKPDHRRTGTRVGRQPGPASRRPDVVRITGAGSNPKGTPEGYRLRGHHFPERCVLEGPGEQRAPELFIAGELLPAGTGRSWRSCCTRPPTPWPPGAASKTPAPRATATTTNGLSPWPPSWAWVPPTRLPHHTLRIDSSPAPVPGRPGQPGPPRRSGRWRGPERRRPGQARQAWRTADRCQVRVPARAPPHPAHTQADRRRPDHLQSVLRPLPAARRQRGTLGRHTRLRRL